MEEIKCAKMLKTEVYVCLGGQLSLNKQHIVVIKAYVLDTGLTLGVVSATYWLCGFWQLI